jgi:DOMON domain
MKVKIFILSFLFILIIFSGCETVKDEILGPEPTPPDTLGFVSVTSAGVTLKFKVVETDLHCILSTETSGWISVGFNPSSMMKDANFIIGYVSGGTGFMRDDWGISSTTHSSDVGLGGTEDIELIDASESSGVSELEFKIPLDSGDQFDRVLEIDQTYPIILARGDTDDFDSYHSDVGYANITLSEGGGGGGGGGNSTAFPDTTLYLSLESADMKFYWLVDPDTIHCLVSAPTSGWLGIGFDPSNIMEDANFIIGYVENDSVGYIRDDWGDTPYVHSADVGYGGTDDLYNMGGLESGGETFIYFSMPLDSGDAYDKPLIWDESYPLILAYGTADNFSAMHTSAGFSSFTVNNTSGGGNSGVTTGGDISLDNDTQGFITVVKSDITFKWKVVGDSLRCMVLAPTTGWLAVGFDPTEEMQDANFLIGYVVDGTTYIRDDFGVTKTTHLADVGLGGENHVTRVFGHEQSGISEIRFTIPLNSGDQYDRVLIPGQTYEIILAFGLNGADDFSSMHDEADNTDINL